MKSLLIILILVAVSGCASNQNKVVSVPVSIPCKITAPDKPVFAVSQLPLGSDIYDKMAALRAERLQRMGYEGELEAAIRTCQ